MLLWTDDSLLLYSNLNLPCSNWIFYYQQKKWIFVYHHTTCQNRLWYSFCIMRRMDVAVDEFHRMIHICVHPNAVVAWFMVVGLMPTLVLNELKSIPNELFLVFTVIIRIHNLDSAKVMKRGGVYWIESSNVTVFSDSRFPWCLRCLCNVLHVYWLSFVFCLLSSARICWS